MNKGLLSQLHRFMARAGKATYAGDGQKVAPWRTGFKELEYRKGDWYYRDSYAGSLRSWGQEVIWHKDKPVWTCLYGGGMEADHMDAATAKATFAFLKRALLTGDKEHTFQPRGPQHFREGSWHYHCEVEGDITKFKGHEFVDNGSSVIFTHDFVGGLIVGEDDD